MNRFNITVGRRPDNRWLRTVIVCATVVLTGCAASISSRGFGYRTGEGIVYKLPVREYVVAVTYELTGCNPVKVSAVDVAVSSSLGPSQEESDWFEIDVRTLKQLFSSVDPATIELNRGMLTSVGLKTAGAATQVMTLAKELKEFAAASVSNLTCTPDTEEAVTRQAASVKALAELRAKLRDDEEAFRRQPTQDTERRVKWSEAKVAQAVASQAVIRESRLRKLVTYRLTPRPSEPSEPTCASPKPEAIADWTKLDATNGDEFRRAFRACLTFGSVSKFGNDAPKPAADKPYPGVYYRRPASAAITIDVATVGGQLVYRTLAATELIPQLGTLERVELKGAALGARNVSITFDENGDIKKYEITSKGMAEAMTAALKEADAAFAKEPKPSELDTLTAEVALLQKKRELIDAKAALEAAR